MNSAASVGCAGASSRIATTAAASHMDCSGQMLAASTAIKHTGCWGPSSLVDPQQPASKGYQASFGHLDLGLVPLGKW